MRTTTDELAGGSGILIRYVQPSDPDYALVRASIWSLRKQGTRFSYVNQNFAEYWGVSTRPATSRGGYGLSIAQADARARLLERSFTRLTEPESVYGIWRQLIVA